MIVLHSENNNFFFFFLIGDFRMYFGEDKKKIENIVHNQMDQFRKLYDEPLKLMPLLHWNQTQGVIEVCC